MGTFLKQELFKQLDIMLRRGQQVELSFSSRPALCLAVEHGHTKMVQLLLERSSSILHFLLVMAGLVISGGLTEKPLFNVCQVLRKAVYL